MRVGHGDVRHLSMRCGTFARYANGGWIRRFTGDKVLTMGYSAVTKINKFRRRERLELISYRTSGCFKLSRCLEINPSGPINNPNPMVIRARSNIRVQLPVIELKQLSQLIAPCAHLCITLCSDPFRSQLSELVNQLLSLKLYLGLFLL